MPEQTTGLNLTEREQLMELQTRPLATISGLSSFERLSRLYNIVRSLNSITDLDRLLAQILASATQMVDARGGFFMLTDDEHQKLKCEVTIGVATSGLKGAILPIDQRTVPGMVALQGTPFVENDVSHSPYFATQRNKRRTTIHKLVCVPLKVQDRVTGVVQVIDKVSGDDFNTDDLKLLEAMADTAAVAIENVRLYEAEKKKTDLLKQAYEELHKTYQATLQALTGLLDTRDTATRGHSSRVVALTLRLAQAMGIDDAQRLRTIEQGALLHDVGKIGVADAILRKPGPLDAEEWREMRAHPELGYRMLKDIQFLKNALPIVRYHHERFNGTGYPYGLEGKEIPLEARIFAVADSFDAITSERPYKKARSFEQAAAVLRDDAGKFFDPAVVEAFLSVSEEEWLEILAQVSEMEPPQLVEAPRTRNIDK
jgi:HD-GYP domain-containing protein (c-di-GMP phosphodiesterase class II)